MTLVIYTAITNHYDTLKAPEVYTPDARYVAWLDGDDYVLPGRWEAMRLTVQARNPRVTARHPKLLAHRYHPDAEVSVWVDACLLITHDLTPLVDALTDAAPLVAYAHPERDCVYDEAAAVVAAGVADAGRVDAQVNAYRGEGYPARRGLFQSGLMARRHHAPALVRAQEDWWEDVSQYSQRDQVSGMVALWRHDLTYTPMDGEITDAVRYVHHPRMDTYLHRGRR